MNILLSANEKYYIATKVMLASLLQNNSFEKHIIYFMYTSIPEKKIHALKHFVEQDNRASFVPIYVSKKCFLDLPINHHFSIETYFRFLAQEVIPDTEDRVLWLDVDMIVHKSIKDLYYLDFEGNYLIVAKSINKNPQELLDKLGCPYGTVYFNAGMILFNLELMRNTMTPKDFFVYYENNKDRITWLDQDILNAMFALKTKVVDYRVYNYQMFCNTVFSHDECEKIKYHTAIFHYIGENKPWHLHYGNCFGAYWKYYAKKSLTLREQLEMVKESFDRNRTAKVGKFNILHLLWRIYEISKESLYELKQRILFAVYLKYPLGEKAFIIGTPDHTNIGDSAIVVSEVLFLKKRGVDIKRIKEISVATYKKYESIIVRALDSRVKIFMHGGGNMGDQWLEEELFRRKVMHTFAKNPIVIFPQTYFYTNTEAGKEQEEKSKKTYNDRNNLCIVARENKSYDEMKRVYSDANVLLTPDIVLSTTMDDFGVKAVDRSGILLCFRSDLEKNLTEEQTISLKAMVNELGYEVSEIDMISDVPIYPNSRIDVVRSKMQQMAAAKMVITDRLHGMVFAAITGTPCVVFGNNNHKILGTYEWIRHLDYIRYVDTVQEATRCILELLEKNNCEFINTPFLLSFEPLEEVVREYGSN